MLIKGSTSVKALTDFLWEKNELGEGWWAVQGPVYHLTDLNLSWFSVFALPLPAALVWSGLWQNQLPSVGKKCLFHFGL